MLNLVELQTVLCQAEDIMNSRPLTYVPSDIMQPVTPNNFLRLRNVNVDTQLEVTVEKASVDSRILLEGWKRVNNVIEFYWSQFRSLYLLNLRQFHTNFHRKQKGSVDRLPVLNEVVLLHEPTAPRGVWQLGKIVRLDKNQATASIELPRKVPIEQYLNTPRRLPMPPRTVIERSIRLLHPLELSPV